jgi:two-component system sensor histidine kinase TctE
MRRRLLIGILLPVLALIALNAVSLYRQARASADTAYDRTLLASAKAIGETLEVIGSADDLRVRANVPYSALEAFEADNRSRMYFKVSGFAGQMVSGFEDLPAWHGQLPVKGVYAALVDFYDDHYRGEPVRVAVLLQPVAGVAGQGMATIQVAETLELRQTLARQALVDTLWSQALLLAVIALVVVIVVQRATQPVRDISAHIATRGVNDLSPIEAAHAPRELLPLLDAINQVMARLERLLAHQKRFVRDASHQLRTPLAVLKAQLQSARRGDIDPAAALQEIGQTVERATELANQMLALAKVEQLRQQGQAPPKDWAPIVRAVALDLSALIAEHQLDFDLETVPASVRAHEWALRELTRNLLHNAIKHTPEQGRLSVSLKIDSAQAVLTIADSGSGVSDELRQRLFQPFAAGDGGTGGPDARSSHSGSGLGLAICHEIVLSLGGSIALENRLADGGVAGLDASVRLALADNPG